MDMGIGFSELLLILLLILVFFGSKEFPRFIREGARLLARMRSYSEKVKRELNGISDGSESPPRVTDDENIQIQKKELRNKYLALRRSLVPAIRTEKSGLVCGHLKESTQFRNAAAVMIYVNMGSEVETRELITEMARSGKRVIIPYCKSGSRSMGIGEITNIGNDIIIGEGNVPEPRFELRDHFLLSDLRLIVCPGVSFDTYGGRLGRGSAYYDNFLRELKGRVPLFGLSFDCQMHEGHLPFSYNDVPMEQVVTESGLKLPDRLAG
jgi:5-formyltetrahydrofolate cyclo-ligase